MTKHATVRFRLRAVIGSFDFTDIVQYSASFAMNTIPTASLILPVGRGDKNQQLATIHNAVKEIRPQMPVAVYLTCNTLDRENATTGVPDGEEIQIFEGIVAGTGWQRTSKGAHFVLHLLHWLTYLNDASAVSASLHPGSPADLAYPAVFPAIGLNNANPGSSPIPAWVPNLSSKDVNIGTLTDIWGNIMLPWLTTLSNDDPYDSALRDVVGVGDPDILDALSRMAPNPDGQPLELDLQGAAGAVLSDGMRTALVNEIGGSWINTTLWGKLVGEWAPAYWFSVIPRVSDALIVPFTGGLRGEPWAVIGDEDYGSAELNGQLHQTLRAVGIAYPIGSATAFDLNVGIQQVARSGLFGLFRPAGLEKGMVLLKDAPKWLSNPVLANTLSLFAEGIDDDSPINTALDEVGAGQAANANLDDNLPQLRGIASAYAHQWYVLEALKGRTGEIVGKLRFDISPGSNVFVVAGGAANIPDAANIQEDIYATVMQVSYVIDAQGQKAATAYTLAHIRTAHENATEGTSIDKPPLYKKAWRGAKLVPAAPGPEQLE